MAGKGGTGTTYNGRDSRAKRLGVKLSAGQKAGIGSIIVRQRGTSFLAGQNVRRGSDDTLYALARGVITFTTTRKRLFSGQRRVAKVVSVAPVK